jgi:cell wall-associated NlpC family hydrolase
MPPRLRSLLLAFALAAFVFGWTEAGPIGAEKTPQRSVANQSAASVVHHAPPVRHRRRVAPKPTLGERAARIALKAVGVPYRWGGASPASGFDCSGLVYWAYRHVGVELPHSSYALYDLGRQVPRTRLKAGDLVFFYGLGHVGMYIGRGRMVHAPSSGRHVEVVRLQGSHYGSRFVGARRVMRAI